MIFNEDDRLGLLIMIFSRVAYSTCKLKEDKRLFFVHHRTLIKSPSDEQSINIYRIYLKIFIILIY